MPFDIGLGEWVVIAIVALLIVGPEDLPKMFRKIGNWVGRIRSMSDEFRRTLDSAVDDSGIKTIRDDIKQTELDIRNAARLDELEKSARELEDDLRGDVAMTEAALKGKTSDEIDKAAQSEAKARSEAIRARADTVKAEAKAKMLREQLAKAEAEVEAAKAKVEPIPAPKSTAKSTAKTAQSKAPAKPKPASASPRKTVKKTPAANATAETKSTKSKAATKKAAEG